MTRGRKPTPTNLRLLHGNPARRPFPKNEPKPRVTLPRAPRSISPAAKKHWLPLAKLLLEAKILTSIDATALMLLCEAYATWEQAGQKLLEYGLVIKTPNGYPAQSPYLAIANRAQDQLMKLLTEFGMTPSSRARVAISHDDGKSAPNPDARDLFGS